MHSTDHKARDTRSLGSDQVRRAPDWVGLHPVSIVSVGTSEQPVERLMGLQSRVYRAFVLLGQLASILRRGPVARPAVQARPAAQVRG